LLLVALFSVILSTVQLVYIPEIMEQKEAEHMDEVENQFSHLKSVIDLQSAVKEPVPISTALTLGSQELPYFVSVRAFGRLSVENDFDDNHITISNNTSIRNLDLSAIHFQSANAYFFNQLYVLQGGGVILRQEDDGEAMKMHPSLTFDKIVDEIDPDNITIFLNWTIQNFSAIGGKDSAEGYKSCHIRTRYTDNNSIILVNVSSVNITTNYYHAWNRSIHWLIENREFEDKTYCDEYLNISYIYDEGGSENSGNISIQTNKSENITLLIHIEEVNINVQIGKGTILEYIGKDN